MSGTEVMRAVPAFTSRPNGGTSWEAPGQPIAEETPITVSIFPTAFPTGPAYGTMTHSAWADLATLFLNRRVGNKDGRCFIPATFAQEPDGAVRRLLANVSTRTAIALDCETNKLTGEVPPKFANVVERIKNQSWAAAVYTSHSHTQAAPRYRIVLPLSAEIPPNLPVAEIVADYLDLFGVIDTSKLGPASLFYFPSCEPGSTEHHEAELVDGHPIHAAYIEECAAEVISAREAGQAKARAAALEAAARRREERAKAGYDPDASVVEQIRDRLDLAGELLAHGYKHIAGNRYLYPESETGIPGVYLVTGRDNIERAYSHHSGDPLAAGNLPRGYAKAVDAVDVVAILDHGGDFKTALRALAKRFGLNTQKQTRPNDTDDPGYRASLDADAEAEARRPRGDPDQNADQKAGAQRILTGAAFIARHVPPVWLIDGIVQRSRLYACTSLTGHGKTAAWLFNACMIHAGWQIGHLETFQGNTLFLAGENPSDLEARMIGMANAYNLPRERLPYVLPGGFPLTEPEAEALQREIAALGVPLALIVGDTASSFFPGDDENNNVQAGSYARSLRGFTEQCKGKPAVVALCHPVKNAARNNLLPRGGGAFLNELDGNLTLWSESRGEVTEMHWQGKIRGPDFTPLGYRLRPVATGLADEKGREEMTIIAEPMSEEAVADHAKQALANEDVVLQALRHHPDWSFAQIADSAGWVSDDGKPEKWRVSRAIRSLAADKLIQQTRTGAPWKLTDKGEEALK
jgi:hypothetical protein